MATGDLDGPSTQEDIQDPEKIAQLNRGANMRRSVLLSRGMKSSCLPEKSSHQV